jgi:hypothetical protein
MTRRSIYTHKPVLENGRSYGGAMLLMRTHYPARIARQLAELAESRPTPETYARERARILEAQ